MYETEPSRFLIGLEATWGVGFILSESLRPRLDTESFLVLDTESFLVLDTESFLLLDTDSLLTSAGEFVGLLPCLGRVEANLLPVARSLIAAGSKPNGPEPKGPDGAGAGLGLGG